MDKDYEILTSEIVLKTPYFEVAEEEFIRYDGKKLRYWTVNHQESVFIVPVSDINEIYFIKQFRYPTKRWSLELPAGCVDGDKLLDAGKRELWEETGLTASRWLYLGEFQVAPGLSTNIGHIWMAKGLTQTEENKQHEDGIVGTTKLSIDEIRDKINTGEISDGPTMSVLCKVFWK